MKIDLTPKEMEFIKDNFRIFVDSESISDKETKKMVEEILNKLNRCK